MRKSVGAVCGLVLFAAMVSIAFAHEDQDIQSDPSCNYCGMNRAQFAHSRFLITYDDGSTFGGCSIHCAAIDLAIKIDKTPKSLQVGDYGTKHLIDAEAATWVIGGSKPGVMTKRAKWAFQKKEDAEKFVKESGGEIATFDRAMQAAYEDMYADIKMIREKRKMKGGGGHQHEDSHQHQHKP